MTDTIIQPAPPVEVVVTKENDGVVIQPVSTEVGVSHPPIAEVVLTFMGARGSQGNPGPQGNPGSDGAAQIPEIIDGGNF